MVKFIFFLTFEVAKLFFFSLDLSVMLCEAFFNMFRATDGSQKSYSQRTVTRTSMTIELPAYGHTTGGRGSRAIARGSRRLIYARRREGNQMRMLNNQICRTVVCKRTKAPRERVEPDGIKSLLKLGCFLFNLLHLTRVHNYNCIPAAIKK